MMKFEEHEIRARVNNLFRPILKKLDELVEKSKKTLLEFDTEDFTADSLFRFMGDFSELEYLYDELMDRLNSTLQDIPSESRVARNTLSLLQAIKEIFEDIRIKVEGLKGFLKPNVPNDHALLGDVVKQLNESITKLRKMLCADIYKHIQNLINEYMKFEGFLSEDIEIEEQ